MRLSARIASVSTIALATAFVAQPASAQTTPAQAQPGSGSGQTDQGFLTQTNPVPATENPATAPEPSNPAGTVGGAPAAGNLSVTQSGEQIVVTATPGERSRFKSSISVSQVSGEQIQNFTPRSQAEILRAIPGIQTAANAGPGGNANIGVRGIPVSTGGSEYVALQEDGLPVTLFGDIQFGNNDYWLRFDDTVERVEAVRGGSASTFASQAPGAVINYISQNGAKEHGTIGYTEGLNYRQHRLNFDYGRPLAGGWRFNIGGFAETGAGPSNISYNILRGYQVKASVTKEISDKGYIRVLFKRLDERAPTNTTTPAIAKLDGNKVTGYDTLPGFDPRDGNTYSKYDRVFQVVNTDRNLSDVRVQGIHPKVTSLGGQLHYEFNDHIKVDDNFRQTWMSGSFVNKFLGVTSSINTNVPPAGFTACNAPSPYGSNGVVGSCVNGQVVGSIRYANGPKQGQVFNGAYINTSPNIDTQMRDMGSTANNLQFSAKYPLGPGTATAQAGWFHMSQKIDQTWQVNRQYSEILGKNAAQLDLFSTTGAQLTAAGQAGFNDQWGTGPARVVDLTYTDDAPFVSAGYVWGGLNLDGSVRFDRVRGEGTARAGANGPNYLATDALGTASIPSIISGAATPAERIDYLQTYTSWSVGALYSFTPNTSLFVRASRGGRFNADRRTLAGSVTNGIYSGGNFNPDGSLNAQGKATSVNYLNQQEGGLKQRGSLGILGGAQYTMEATFFHSTLTETNYDFTRTSQPPPNNNPNTSNKYRAYGVEFTGNIAIGNFRLQANATYTDAKIRESITSPATNGNRPGGIPKFQYFVQASYDPGFFAVGLSLDGQTRSYFDDFNSFQLKETNYVNGFLKIRPIQRIELGVNVSNIFNTIGYRGGGNLSTLSSGPLVFSGTANYGRTIDGSVRFSF